MPTLSMNEGAGVQAGDKGCSAPAANTPRLTLARVIGAALRLFPRPALCAHAWKVINALLACRTPLLGAHRHHCADCGRDHLVPHSCRNRHCPGCQAAQSREWLERQMLCLLPVHYFHVVFTLPHSLNALIAQNRRALHDLLFECVSATLLEFGQNKFKTRLGVTAVLHTWSQTLLDHHHLHCIVTGGGLTADGSQWRGVRSGYLFPKRALSKVFRAKYRDGLQRLFDEGKLEFHGQLAGLAEVRAFQQLKREAMRKKWVVYAKRPFAGPEQVLRYLSRYTHRVAIGNGRLLSMDTKARTVTFGYKDYAADAQRKVMTLRLDEFLRRFCLHILPERFVKIRHYGLLANRGRQERIEQARALLPASAPLAAANAEPATVAATETGKVAVKNCPHCGSERVSLVDIYHKPHQIPTFLLREVVPVPDDST
ncbi:MAG: IS91 family transposase [Verrucomicrobia bacterium]|nr:IS91 family transposase [Verrucomicrobiota bacterium]